VQYWDGNNLDNDEQEIYEYDSNNNETLYIVQYWDGSIWVNDHQEISEYDSNNNLTLSLSQSWDGNNWIKVFRELLYYQIISSTSEMTPSGHLFKMFPNPGKDHFFIDFSPNSNNLRNLHIYNTQGQLIFSQTIQNRKNRTSIDLSNFAKGTYFININDGYKQETKKIVILR